MNEFVRKQAAIDLCNQILVSAAEETDIAKVISALILDLMNLPSVQLEQKWVPVSKRLPLLRGSYEISEDVLITNGFDVYMGYLGKRDNIIYWHYYGTPIEVDIKNEDNDVIGWMPLPKPLKAES